MDLKKTHLSRGLFGSAELRDDVDGNWEDDRAVVLGRDAVQRLQVAELEIS